jgi:hypothetical protein
MPVNIRLPDGLLINISEDLVGTLSGLQRSTPLHFAFHHSEEGIIVTLQLNN